MLTIPNTFSLPKNARLFGNSCQDVINIPYINGTRWYHLTKKVAKYVDNSHMKLS